MVVNPMPVMRWQAPGLNCGWFCLEAVLGYHHEKKHNKKPTSIPLPCPTKYGYDPYHDTKNTKYKYVTCRKKPSSVKDWEKLLYSAGPVIVSGKIGGLDHWVWSLVPGGHFILVVGVDVKAQKIFYKDSLFYGDKLWEYGFEDLDAKLQSYVYYVDPGDADKFLNAIGAE